MNKASLLLAVAVGLLIAGLAMSFYGSQLVTEGLSSGTGTITGDRQMEIAAELDPAVGRTAVYVVQVMDFEGTEISVTVEDPLGIEILSADVDRDSYEDRFDVVDSGTHRLVVQNAGAETEVAVVLGHMPDTEALSVGITGFYVLLMGLVAIGALTIHVIRQKRSSR